VGGMETLDIGCVEAVKGKRKEGKHKIMNHFQVMCYPRLEGERGN